MWHRKLLPVCSPQTSSAPRRHQRDIILRHNSDYSRHLSGQKSYLGELVERGVGGVMGDKEPHALVGNLDCSGAVHVGETA